MASGGSSWFVFEKKGKSWKGQPHLKLSAAEENIKKEENVFLFLRS